MHMARVSRLFSRSALSRMTPIFAIGSAIGSTVVLGLGLGLVTGCTVVDEDGGSASLTEALSAADVAVEESGACQVPGTLAYHAAQASASGKFDYDPPGGLVERVRGRYRDRSGRFHWKERFADGSYLDRRSVRGEAAAFDAQQSLTYQIETTDVRGAVSVTEVEEAWDGCTVERQFRAQGATDWLDHFGSYDGTTYTYVEEQVPYRNADRLPLIAVNGERYADQSFIEQFEGGGYPEYYQTRTGDGLGNENLNWEINYGDGYIYGFVESSASGTRRHFTRSLSDGDGCTSTWSDQTIAYDGNGSGASQICDFSNDEYGEAVGCTLAITPTQCVETCANGAVNVRPSCL
jgi:hypothetical protein